MNTFLFLRYGIRMLYFFFLFSQRVQILKRVQIRLIWYSSQPTRLQIFFQVSDKSKYLIKYYPYIKGYQKRESVLLKIFNYFNEKIFDKHDASKSNEMTTSNGYIRI